MRVCDDEDDDWSAGSLTEFSKVPVLIVLPEVLALAIAIALEFKRMDLVVAVVGNRILAVENPCESEEENKEEEEAVEESLLDLTRPLGNVRRISKQCLGGVNPNFNVIEEGKRKGEEMMMTASVQRGK